MNKFIFYMALFLFSSSSYAQLDYKISHASRTLPSALSFKVDTGYSQKIWGETSDINYGYIRPSIAVQSSAVVNYIHTQVSIYPISFFGINFGKSKGTRNVTTLHNFDCERVECGGRTTRLFFGTDFALAYKKLSLLTYIKRESIELSDNTNIYADEFSTLEASGKESVTSLTNILAYQVTKKWTSAFLLVHNSTKNTAQKSIMTMALAQYQLDKWSFGIGLGNFHTKTRSNHFSSLLLISWNGKKGLRLY